MQLLQGGGYNRSKEEGATDSKRVDGGDCEGCGLEL